MALQEAAAHALREGSNYSDTSLSQPIGILLVHGIGSQQPGDSSEKFAKAFRNAYPDLACRRETDCLVLTAGSRALRAYEVYWADLLEGESIGGTFDPLEFHSLAWFPYLNLTAGLYVANHPVRVFLWTMLLSPIAMAAHLLYWLARILRIPKTAFDRTLADVTNYVNSAARTLGEESSLRPVAGQILRRFDMALRKAREDRCGTVHVVAHSLGTVIAYHALSHHLEVHACPPNARDGLRLVHSFFTIGSPLEKIRFVWPDLVESRPLVREGTSQDDSTTDGKDHACLRLRRWENFYNPLDLVSGRLRHAQHWGEVHNHKLLGRTGYARAHTTYELDPRFLRVVSKILLGTEAELRVNLLTRARLLAGALGESLAVVGVLLLAVAVPTVLLGLLGLVIAWWTAFGGTVEALQSGVPKEHLGGYFRFFFRLVQVSIAAFFLLAPPLYGRIRAGFDHYLHQYHEPAVMRKTRFTQWVERIKDRLDVKSPPKPSRRAYIRRLLFLIVLLPALFGLGTLWDLEIEMPWAPDHNIAWRFISPLILIILGVLLLALVVSLLALTLALAWWILRIFGAYMDWRQATITPPLSAEGASPSADLRRTNVAWKSKQPRP